MQKIFVMGLLGLFTNVYATQGEFFTFSGTSSSSTVGLNVSNKTYNSVGIKLNNGYTLSNAASECSMNSNGYCIFSLNANSPKTLSISGTGNQVGATICLNAQGSKPVSCQSYAYSVTGGSSSDYVYVVNSGNDTISLCETDSSGTLVNCADSGATALSAPQSIVLNDAATYAYITNLGSGPANGSITACRVDPTSKQLGSCSSTSLASAGIISSAPDPNQIAYLKQSGSEYLYFAGSGSDGRVYKCLVSGAMVSGCGVTGPSSTSNYLGIAINGSTAYVIDNSTSQFYNCSIGVSGALTCGSATSFGTNNPEYVSVNVGATNTFIPFYNGGITYLVNSYSILNGSMTSTLLASSNSTTFDQPLQATPNSTGTYIYISNRAGGTGFGTVASCRINTNSSLTNCNTSNELFSVPKGIAVLSR